MRSPDERAGAGSFDVDLAVIADHQAQRPWAQVRAADDGLAADQAVFETRDVDHLAALHDDGVLDFAVGDLTAVTDRRERADEAVGDSRSRTDHQWAAQRRVGDDRPGLDDDPTVDGRRV